MKFNTKSSGAFKWVTWAVVWIFTLVVVCGLLFVSHVKKIRITTVRLQSQVQFDSSELRQRIGVQFPAPYLDVDVSEVEEKLEMHPLVYDAKVKKTLKGELLISTTRSEPLIAVLAKEGTIYMPAYFDASGRCVQVGARGGIVDVPIVSGVSIVSPVIGVMLPPRLQNFLGALNEIKRKNDNLLRNISEIKVHVDNDDYATIEIWFVEYPQKYIMDIEIETKMLERLWLFADRVNSSGIARRFSVFDLRQGVIIGKRKMGDEEI